MAGQFGVRHEILRTGEMEDTRYLANTPERCYYCRLDLFGRVGDFLQKHNLEAIVIGVNADDHDDWRPGLKAARENGARMPLGEAGLTKAEIRELSRRMGLPTHSKPSSPCLSSRIPYGQPITREKLRQIEQAEQFLHLIGFDVCRLRHHGDLARIEVPAERIGELCEPETRQKVDRAMRDCGFTFVAVDLRGFRSGSLNEIISADLREGSR